MRPTSWIIVGIILLVTSLVLLVLCCIFLSRWKKTIEQDAG